MRAGALGQVRDILRAGGDVNGRGVEGLTPLMIAAGTGQLQMVDLLLTAGADPNVMEQQMGATALHKAAQSGGPEVIDLLLKGGAFIDVQSPVLGNTPLMDAILYKHEAAVDLLLRRGARTAIRNHWQQSATDLARDEGHDAMVACIAQKEGADAEQMDALSLLAAATTGDLAEADRLLNLGADPNERAPIIGGANDDYTPLGAATREGRADIVSLLLDKGADPGLVFGLMRGTALHEASYFGHAGALRVLLERGDRDGMPRLELDAQGPYNGFTPLHDAVWHGHLEAARMLVESGAPLHLRSHAGQTPYELAVLYGYDEMAEMLRQAESPPER